MGSTIYGISPAGNQPFAFLGPIAIIQVHKWFSVIQKTSSGFHLDGVYAHHLS
jgi:hypothetical protein